MDEIDKIENSLLRDRILELNEEQLKIVSHMAKNYFIMEYIDLERLEKDNFLIKGLDNSLEKNRLLDIYNELLNKFMDLVNGRHFDRKEILILREELYNYSNILSAYSTELLHTRNRMDYVLTKGREDSLELMANLHKTRDRLVDDIEKEITSLDKEPIEYMNFMATVTNILPFKLSRYKYYDLIRDSLMNNLKDYSQEYAIYQIQEYKKQFAPKLNRGYGLFFDEYFTKIEEASRLDLENMSPNLMKESIRSYNKLLDNMDYNMMNIRRIGILTNRLLTMGTISGEYGVEFDKNIIDKFENMDRGVDELVRKTFVDREEELFEVVEEFKRYNDEGARRLDYEYNLDDEFEKSRKMLVYYNDIEFLPSKILNIENFRDKVDTIYLEKLINNFIDFIKRNIKDLDNLDGRLRMKKLLTVFTPSFKNKNEFMNYVRYSLDNRIISDRELNVAVMSLNYIIIKRKG